MVVPVSLPITSLTLTLTSPPSARLEYCSPLGLNLAYISQTPRCAIHKIGAPDHPVLVSIAC
jgi:hypothetical protein